MVTIEEVVRIKYKIIKRYIDIYVDRVEFYNGKGILIDTFYIHEIDCVTYNIKFGIRDFITIILSSGRILNIRYLRRSLVFGLKKNKNREKWIRVSKDEYERISKLIPLDIKII